MLSTGSEESSYCSYRGYKHSHISTKQDQFIHVFIQAYQEQISTPEAVIEPTISHAL